MPLFHLRLSAPHSTLDHVPLFGYVAEANHFPLNTEHLNYHLRVLRNRSPSFASVCSFPQLHYIGAMQIGVGMDEKCDIANLSHSIVSRKPQEQQNVRKEVQLIGQNDSTVSISNKDYKERERRKKIGLANKGKVPWNKGRKHSAETCERIKRQTIEALKDPKVKVRKKMSQRPRSHSVESKAKMSSSLRRLWGRRLKWKRSREKLFLSWVESIAEAAKTGGSEQQELNWDSYENIKEELYLQQLQQAAEKKKARERAKMRAKEAAARAKVKKKARRAIERRVDSETNKDNEELTSLKGLKVKQRSTKLDRETSTNDQVASRRDIVKSQLHISALEKLDAELIKREKLRAEVSFADQIRAAKNRKMEQAMAAPSVGVVNEKPGMHTHTLLQSQ
ncbi:uncharacterized protein LOC133728152 isoform X1 [Rosa rugosa]|uniref:uncharacterized protein LOC133728152 isoform X1 n=1 Tax=Rosa rugosa TaxID=74645 RepID=UPI002B4170A7|nr:uncharacterized protein LOC133728152 isoform X1 [Rosa rugosa]